MCNFATYFHLCVRLVIFAFAQVYTSSFFCSNHSNFNYALVFGVGICRRPPWLLKSIFAFLCVFCQSEKCFRVNNCHRDNAFTDIVECISTNSYKKNFWNESSGGGGGEYGREKLKKFPPVRWAGRVLQQYCSILLYVQSKCIREWNVIA